MASTDNDQNKELKANQSTGHPERTDLAAEHHENTANHYDDSGFMIFNTEINTHLSMEDIAKEAENIVNAANAGAQAKKFGELRDAFNAAWEEELKDKKHVYIADGGNADDFEYQIKKDQQENLERKIQLIQAAKDNQNSEDWDTAVPLFKKLQEEWKAIGHVPRSQSNRIWDEFRDACNHFFAKFREKGNPGTDDWRTNYKKKKALLDELKDIEEGENSAEPINIKKKE
ncbi:hypothetical protein FQR65_LT15326 [Abscondita terminalis]|nr:hypothetical protein FQR65_LT15326 [Abscondita terminalis]